MNRFSNEDLSAFVNVRDKAILASKAHNKSQVDRITKERKAALAKQEKERKTKEGAAKEKQLPQGDGEDCSITTEESEKIQNTFVQKTTLDLVLYFAANSAVIPRHASSSSRELESESEVLEEKIASSSELLRLDASVLYDSDEGEAKRLVEGITNPDTSVKVATLNFLKRQVEAVAAQTTMGSKESNRLVWKIQFSPQMTGAQIRVGARCAKTGFTWVNVQKKDIRGFHFVKSAELHKYRRLTEKKEERFQYEWVLCVYGSDFSDQSTYKLKMSTRKDFIWLTDKDFMNPDVKQEISHNLSETYEVIEKLKIEFLMYQEQMQSELQRQKQRTDELIEKLQISFLKDVVLGCQLKAFSDETGTYDKAQAEKCILGAIEQNEVMKKLKLIKSLQPSTQSTGTFVDTYVTASGPEDFLGKLVL